MMRPKVIRNNPPAESMLVIKLLNVRSTHECFVRIDSSINFITNEEYNAPHFDIAEYIEVVMIDEATLFASRSTAMLIVKMLLKKSNYDPIIVPYSEWAPFD